MFSRHAMQASPLTSRCGSTTPMPGCDACCNNTARQAKSRPRPRGSAFLFGNLGRLVVGQIQARPDIYLRELQAELRSERGVEASLMTICNACRAPAIAKKDVDCQRAWAKTNMTRRKGRALRGERVVEKRRCGRWHTTTFLGALRATGFVAPSRARSMARSSWLGCSKISPLPCNLATSLNSRFGSTMRKHLRRDRCVFRGKEPFYSQEQTKGETATS